VNFRSYLVLFRPLPSLVDLTFIRVASSLEEYPDTSRLPDAVKKRMLDFLIRINNGRVPRSVLDRLLDGNIQELDLVSCEFNEADYHHLAITCTNVSANSLET
jgi:hypothetical protein